MQHYMGRRRRVLRRRNRVKHKLTMDGAPEAGAQPRTAPYGTLLLAGTGGVTAFDVVMMILKEGIDIARLLRTLPPNEPRKT